jgi:hypothetical protein
MTSDSPKSVEYKFSEPSGGLSAIARTVLAFLLGVIIASAATFIFYRSESTSFNDLDVRRAEAELRAEQKKTADLTKQLHHTQQALQTEKAGSSLSDSRVAELEKKLAGAPTKSTMTISDMQSNLSRYGFDAGKADGLLGHSIYDGPERCAKRLPAGVALARDRLPRCCHVGSLGKVASDMIGNVAIFLQEQRREPLMV